MTDPLQDLLNRNAIQTNPFSPTSRYARTPIATLKMPDGHVVVFLRRRFLPPPENFSLLQEYAVKQDDRLDNIAAQAIGDAEQFWQLCDANQAMNPDELTETPGRRLRITLPEGIPGSRRD